ncbi:MAG: hypothetical protein HC859_10635 [Bacteroidia bacterium]|nr:hypothetical protein [Bacteroidia bacterium]
MDTEGEGMQGVSWRDYWNAKLSVVIFVASLVSGCSIFVLSNALAEFSAMPFQYIPYVTQPLPWNHCRLPANADSCSKLGEASFVYAMFGSLQFVRR